MSLAVSAVALKVDMLGPRGYGEILGAFLPGCFCATAVATLLAAVFAADGRGEGGSLEDLWLEPVSSKPVNIAQCSRHHITQHSRNTDIAISSDKGKAQYILHTKPQPW